MRMEHHLPPSTHPSSTQTYNLLQPNFTFEGFHYIIWENLKYLELLNSKYF